MYSKSKFCRDQSGNATAARRSRVLLMLLAAVSPAVFGQAMGLNVGEAKVYPSVRLAYFTDDNTFATQENKVKSSGILLQPAVRYVADKGQNSLELGYRGDYVSSDRSAANFDDHQLYLRGKLAISSKSLLTSNISYNAEHFNFGRFLSSGAQSNTLSEPYQFNEFRFDTRYRYGAERAKGNISFGLGARNRQYTNDPDPAPGDRTDGLEFTQISPYAVLSIRLTGDTRAFLDLRFDNYDYGAFSNPDTPQLDNDRFRVFVGSSWQVTGRSGGSFKVGNISTDYSNPARLDNDKFGYELDAFYAFRSYSRFEISLKREQDSVTESETQELGRRDTIDVTWNHEWSSRLSSNVGVEYVTTFSECLQGSGLADRQNNNLELSTEFDLQIRRWISVGLGYELDDGQSDTCPAGSDALVRDFKRNRVDVHVTVTL